MKLLQFSAAIFGALSFLGATATAQVMTEDRPVVQASERIPISDTWKPSLTKDGVVDKVPHQYVSIDLGTIREADVAWSRRVWREIDVRQKQNQAFSYVGDEYTGGGAFIEILRSAVSNGDLTAYSDDRFTLPMNAESIQEIFVGTKELSPQIDPETGEQTMVEITHEFDINSVTKYRIKEDWIFDRNSGRLKVFIVGIAPLKDKYTESGDFLTSYPMFWLYYSELREKVLSQFEVYNPYNDVRRMTWANYFDNRYFTSYVIKTSANNPLGVTFGNGLKALMNGEKAMEDIRNREMDMWEN